MKPGDKARKGQKGKKQPTAKAAPKSKNGAAQGAKPQNRERLRQRNRTAAQKKQAGRSRDALGRRLRTERRKTEELRAIIGPISKAIAPLHSSRIGPMARRLREAGGISVQAMAELTGLTVKGVQAFEDSKNGGQNQTLALICKVLRIKQSAFHQQIEEELENEAGGPG